jgi:hypothetical protein
MDRLRSSSRGEYSWFSNDSRGFNLWEIAIHV